MTSLANAEGRMMVDDAVISEARHAADDLLEGQAVLTIQRANGTSEPLPNGIQHVLRDALESLADRGSVSIGLLPEELTSTVAADLLGVSRPTLIKLAGAGDIAAHKVGTHSRFRREDVLALRDKRAQERRRAFEELLALEDQD